jgi:hypothetical protein
VDIIDQHGNRRIAQAGEILRDGERVHVPALFMDGNPRLLHDGMGNAAGHKPGYCFAEGPAACIADAALDAARREYDAMLIDAWRGPASKRAAPFADTGHDPYAAYEERLTSAWRAI